MITVRLKGGLGNQLFQYAAARALAEQHQTRVAFDQGFLHNRDKAQHTFREYELDVFAIPSVEPTLSEQIAFGLVDTPFGGLLRKVVRRVLSGNVYHETSYVYDAEIARKTSHNTYLNGYFASEKYFKPIEPLLRSELQFKHTPSSPLADTIRGTYSVSLHIRRGDYVTNLSASHYHGLCPPQYYKDAVDYIAQRHHNLHLFVFSDDLEWVRRHLALPFPVSYVEGNTGKNSYKDMQLMSLCQHHIVANSTFSWWGAWLNPSPDKVVIAPRRWFAEEKAQQQAADIVPDSWIRL